MHACLPLGAPTIPVSACCRRCRAGGARAGPGPGPAAERPGDRRLDQGGPPEPQGKSRGEPCRKGDTREETPTCPSVQVQELDMLFKEPQLP